jgi:hypothetical protein
MTMPLTPLGDPAAEALLLASLDESLDETG